MKEVLASLALDLHSKLAVDAFPHVPHHVGDRAEMQITIIYIFDPNSRYFHNSCYLFLLLVCKKNKLVKMCAHGILLKIFQQYMIIE